VTRTLFQSAVNATGKIKLMLIKTTISAIAFGSLISLPGYAADSSMTMTATVVASPCTFDTANSLTVIPLGDIFSDQMTGPANRSGDVFFDLSFKDCPAGTTSIVATFSGTDNPETLGGKTFLNVGTAKNVGIQVKPKYGNWDVVSLSNGSTLTTTVNEDKSATFNMVSRMFTPTGGATPGTVKAVVTMSFTYQ